MALNNSQNTTGSNSDSAVRLNAPHPSSAYINTMSCNPKFFLNIAHLNTCSAYPDLDEIRLVMRSSNLHGLAISETWYKKGVHTGTMVEIPEFKLFRNDRKSKRGGGVALYLRKEIKSSYFLCSDESSLVEYLFVKSIINGTKFLIGTVYNPSRENDISAFLNTLESVICQFDHVILLGDFNINLLQQDNVCLKFLDNVNSLALSSVPFAATHFWIESEDWVKSHFQEYLHTMI